MIKNVPASHICCKKKKNLDVLNIKMAFWCNLSFYKGFKEDIFCVFTQAFSASLQNIKPTFCSCQKASRISICILVIASSWCPLLYFLNMTICIDNRGIYSRMQTLGLTKSFISLFWCNPLWNAFINVRFKRNRML